MKWISSLLFLGQKLEMKLKRVLSVVISVVTPVVIELQQVSTHREDTPHGVGAQHESGSVHFRASSSAH